mgnify:CR=1 FL=1
MDTTKQFNKGSAELALFGLKQATETLLLILLSTHEEGSVDRIGAGISTVAGVLRDEINNLGEAAGFGPDYFNDGVK